LPRPMTHSSLTPRAPIQEGKAYANHNANVERYIRLLVSRSDYRLQAQQEHRAILASARVRNAASLSALVEDHALETAVQLRQFLLLHQETEIRGDRKKPLRRLV
jgi:hypothetical protein